MHARRAVSLLVFLAIAMTTAFAVTPTGSGTTNYMAKWTSSTNLGSSAICQSVTGGSIGLGTCTPSQKLHVVGNAIVTGPSFSLTGQTAVLYLGNTNQSLKAVYGQGLVIGVYQQPNAIKVNNGGGTVFAVTAQFLGGVKFADGTTQSTAQLVGPMGPQGLQGTPGLNGQAATVSVGTTTTLAAGSSATVSNTGTSTNAVLTFGIPKGDAGQGGGSTAYYTQSTQGSFASSPQMIVSLYLPAGTYLLNGKVSASGTGNYYEYAYCSLVSGGNVLDQSMKQDTYSYTYYYTLPVQGIVTLTASATVKLNCYDSSGATVQYASLSAIPVTTMNTQMKAQSTKR